MLDNAVLTDAMDVVLQWGPEAQIPREVRLRRNHPNLTDDEVRIALDEAGKVIGEAESHAGNIKTGETGAFEALQKDRPWLTDQQTNHAIQQGMYYHWKDHGW
jgi:hypothetical protein